MNDCQNVCGTTACNSHANATPTSFGFTRRTMLRGLAAGLATVGLTAASQAAFAATKKITVCKTTDIKVGSGKIFSPKGGAPVLIVQPKKGVFRAFSPFCTHQGVQLAGIQGTNLVCDQHGAMFNWDSGKVTQGPAQTALPKFTVSVSGTSVQVAF